MHQPKHDFLPKDNHFLIHFWWWIKTVSSVGQALAVKWTFWLIAQGFVVSQMVAWDCCVIARLDWWGLFSVASSGEPCAWSLMPDGPVLVQKNPYSLRFIIITTLQKKNAQKKQAEYLVSRGDRKSKITENNCPIKKTGIFRQLWC